MGSRCYIGYLREDNQVQYVYCHSGAYMDENGEILFQHYADADKVRSLIAGGNMSYIDDDGKAVYYEGENDETCIMQLSEFQDFKDSDIESMFLFKEGVWHVKSDHIEDSDGETWHALKTILDAMF